MKIYSLKGQIHLNCEIRFGTVIFGKDFDHFPQSLLPIKLLVNNKLTFCGPTIISGGTTITSWTGEISIGKYTSIGSGNVLKSNVKIDVGDYSRIVSNCIVMDTNVHFVADKHGLINNIYGEIQIGRYCWINSGTVVTKGTKLPDYSITGRNSYINKDYTEDGEGLLIVGTPGVIKNKNNRQIFNFTNEIKLKDFFLSNINKKDVDVSFIGYEVNFIEEDKDFQSYYRLY
jgi:acetyltransferase-like isoleucine patch superfamily enzyme